MTQSIDRPVLVTGARGLLGSAVIAELQTRRLPHAGWSREDADLTRPDVVSAAFTRLNPGAVVHCAGWTRVDLAEEQPDACRAANVTASGFLAGCAARTGASFAYVSSGGVFDGRKDSPYDEHDEPAPLNVYHRSKLDGEKAVLAAHPAALVARVGWLFGGDHTQPKNFVAARLRDAAARPVISGDTGQRGSPTWTRDAARCLLDLLLAGRSGICHVANEGMASRFDYVAAILRLAGSPTRVEPSGAFPRRAVVPANEAICSVQLPAWGHPPLQGWMEALAAYITADPAD